MFSIRLLRLHANLPVSSCGQDSRSAAFAARLGRKPVCASPRHSRVALLRSLLVLTRLSRLHANLLVPPCGQDSRSAAFASFAGRHPGAAFPAPELSSLLRSSLVLTRLSRLLSHCFFSPQSWQCSIRCIRRSPRAQTRLRFSSAQSSGASSKLTRLRAAS